MGRSGRYDKERGEREGEGFGVASKDVSPSSFLTSTRTILFPIHFDAAKADDRGDLAQGHCVEFMEREGSEVGQSELGDKRGKEGRDLRTETEVIFSSAFPNSARTNPFFLCVQGVVGQDFGQTHGHFVRARQGKGLYMNQNERLDKEGVERGEFEFAIEAIFFSDSATTAHDNEFSLQGSAEEVLTEECFNAITTACGGGRLLPSCRASNRHDAATFSEVLLMSPSDSSTGIHLSPIQVRHATVMHANTFDREMAASGGGGLPNQRYATGLHDAVVSMTATFTEVVSSSAFVASSRTEALCSLAGEPQVHLTKHFIKSTSQCNKGRRPAQRYLSTECNAKEFTAPEPDSGFGSFPTCVSPAQAKNQAIGMVAPKSNAIRPTTFNIAKHNLAAVEEEKRVADDAILSDKSTEPDADVIATATANVVDYCSTHTDGAPWDRSAFYSTFKLASKRASEFFYVVFETLTKDSVTSTVGTAGYSTYVEEATRNSAYITSRTFDQRTTTPINKKSNKELCCIGATNCVVTTTYLDHATCTKGINNYVHSSKNKVGLASKLTNNKNAKGSTREGRRLRFGILYRFVLGLTIWACLVTAQATEYYVNSMLKLFNKVSNGDHEATLNTGNSIMSNSDAVVVAGGEYICLASGMNCASIETMLYTIDLNGEIKCVNDSGSCVLDGKNTRQILYVEGTFGNKLTLRSITFLDGESLTGAGLSITTGAVMDLNLCFFSECRATAVSPLGGGAIWVQGVGTTVNIYGTRFTNNKSNSGYGDDVFHYSGTITIHNTCPSPYSSITPLTGSALDNCGTIGGSEYSYSGCTQQEHQIANMNDLFNKVSNADETGYSSGTSLMGAGDTVVLAVSVYKCSDGACAHSMSMLRLNSSSGEVKCVDDNASCELNGEQKRKAIYVSGSSGRLTIRAIAFKDGYSGSTSGGGAYIDNGAIVDLRLCIFTDCVSMSSSRGGGAIYIASTGGTVNIYGTAFTGNVAPYGDGNDIYNNAGTITIHNTCPSPYSSESPVQGMLLDHEGTIDGYPFAYYGCQFTDASVSNLTSIPTQAPTQAPSLAPTSVPTQIHTSVPTEAPTLAPTLVPSQEPTQVITLAPTPAPRTTPAFSLSGSNTGQCSVYGNCFSSFDYGNNEDCTFTASVSGYLIVNSFESEPNKDVLVVDGEDYSGAPGPHGIGIQAGQTIMWTSDEATTYSGFEICILPGEVSSDKVLVGALVGTILLFILSLFFFHHRFKQVQKNRMAIVAPSQNSKLRMSFNDAIHDKARLMTLANVMKNETQEYSDNDKKAIMKGKKLYNECKASTRIMKEIKSPDDKVDMKLINIEGESVYTGVQVCIVDTSIEECAAWVYCDLDSNQAKGEIGRKFGIVDMQTRHINKHSLYYMQKKDLKIPFFKIRMIKSKVIWEKDEAGRVVIVTDNVDPNEDVFPSDKSTVLTYFQAIWYFEALDPIGDVQQTLVSFTSKGDIKGNVPSAVVNKIAPNFMVQVARLRTVYDKSEQIEAYKREKEKGRDKACRNDIEPSLLVDRFEIMFERNKDGDKISLGKGAFGMVLLVRFGGTRCAYKEMLPSKMNDTNLTRFFLELKLIGKLRHPNIAQCLGVVWEPEEHGIIFELCKNGGLDDFLKKYSGYGLFSWSKTAAVQASHKKVSSQQIKKEIISEMLLKGDGIKTNWALQVARGCAFLHAKRPPIIHRDLKCANILVSDDLRAKITDFGESRSVTGGNDGTMTSVGTPYFMAPEVFSADSADKQYGKKVDVYSFGITLLEIFYDGDVKKAFNNIGGMIVMRRVEKGWRPDMSRVESESECLAETIRSCLRRDPEERPTFLDLIETLEDLLVEAGLETKFQLVSEKKVLEKKEDKPKTLEPQQKKKLAAAPRDRRANSQVQLKAGPIDPMDIFAMGKDLKKETKREPEKVKTVKLRKGSMSESNVVSKEGSGKRLSVAEQKLADSIASFGTDFMKM